MKETDEVWHPFPSSVQFPLVFVDDFAWSSLVLELSANGSIMTTSIYVNDDEVYTAQVWLWKELEHGDDYTWQLQQPFGRLVEKAMLSAMGTRLVTVSEDKIYLCDFNQ